MPHYQCLRCSKRYTAIAEGESERWSCFGCGGMQFAVSNAPVIAGVARGFEVAGGERAIEQGEHGCLPFRSDTELRRIAIPFMGEGMVAGESVICILDTDLDMALRECLGPEEREHITSIPASVQFGVHFEPQRTMRRIRAIIQNVDGPVRLLLGMDRQTLRMADANGLVEFERMVHIEAASEDISLLCVYDMSEVSDSALEAMRLTHPIVAGRFGFRPNLAFEEPLIAA